MAMLALAVDDYKAKRLIKTTSARTQCDNEGDLYAEAAKAAEGQVSAPTSRERSSSPYGTHLIEGELNANIDRISARKKECRMIRGG
jgi:hypothetical protein